jgi:hypothetical protein
MRVIENKTMRVDITRKRIGLTSIEKKTTPTTNKKLSTVDLR